MLMFQVSNPFCSEMHVYPCSSAMWLWSHKSWRNFRGPITYLHGRWITPHAPLRACWARFVSLAICFSVRLMVGYGHRCPVVNLLCSWPEGKWEPKTLCPFRSTPKHWDGPSLKLFGERSAGPFYCLNGLEIWCIDWFIDPNLHRWDALQIRASHPVFWWHASTIDGRLLSPTSSQSHPSNQQLHNWT